MLRVEVPVGVVSGQEIIVRAPNGIRVRVRVPDGVSAGQAFQVTVPATVSGGSTASRVSSGSTASLAALPPSDHVGQPAVTASSSNSATASAASAAPDATDVAGEVDSASSAPCVRSRKERDRVLTAMPDDDNEKREPGPYMLFCKEERPKIVKANQQMTFGQVGKALGEAWCKKRDTDTSRGRGNEASPEAPIAISMPPVAAAQARREEQTVVGPVGLPPAPGTCAEASTHDSSPRASGRAGENPSEEEDPSEGEDSSEGEGPSEEEDPSDREDSSEGKDSSDGEQDPGMEPDAGQWSQFEATEAELVAEHPRFGDLVGADVCVMHAAYSADALTRSGAVGWRAQVTHTRGGRGGPTTQVQVFGNWFELSNELAIRPVRQSRTSALLENASGGGGEKKRSRKSETKPPTPAAVKCAAPCLAMDALRQLVRQRTAHLLRDDRRAASDGTQGRPQKRPCSALWNSQCCVPLERSLTRRPGSRAAYPEPILRSGILCRCSSAGMASEGLGQVAAAAQAGGSSSYISQWLNNKWHNTSQKSAFHRCRRWRLEPNTA